MFVFGLTTQGFGQSKTFHTIASYNLLHYVFTCHSNLLSTQKLSRHEFEKFNLVNSVILTLTKQTKIQRIFTVLKCLQFNVPKYLLF